MSRALEGVLDQLHSDLAATLSKALKAASESDSGPSPQLLGQVIKFLKDNGIDSPAKAQRITDLADQLAAMPVDLDEVALRRPN